MIYKKGDRWKVTGDWRKYKTYEEAVAASGEEIASIEEEHNNDGDTTEWEFFEGSHPRVP